MVENTGWLENYDADEKIDQLKNIEERTEQNQRDLSEILRRDPSTRNFLRVYSIVEALRVKERGPGNSLKNDYEGSALFGHILDSMAPNATVLEVGCGDGELCEILNKKGFKVMGIDCASSSVELARARLGMEKQNDIAQLDCRKMKDVRDEAFDYVISNQVVEHVGLSGFCAHLEHVQRILKKNGKYFISCPSALRSAEVGDLHIKNYYFREMVQIAKMLGFETRMIFGVKGKILTLPSVMNPFIVFYEQLLRLTRLNLIFNYLDILFLCLPMHVVFTKTFSNEENMGKRERITKMQGQGLYR